MTDMQTNRMSEARMSRIFGFGYGIFAGAGITLAATGDPLALIATGVAVVCCVISSVKFD
jgi:hypothetical protein